MAAKEKSPVSGLPATLPVLIVQHAPHEHPAAIQRALETQGIETLVVRSYEGDAYPQIQEIRGMISLGGPMGANDDSQYPWIPIECRLLKRSVEAGLPTIGICLGGQMMARALGGRVERHDKYEIGWFPIELSAAGKSDPILGVAGETPMVYQWHEDTFYLPEGAELLAGSKTCPRQAYRFKHKAYGFQFHPEADHQLVHEWLAVDGIEKEILEIQKNFGAKTVQTVSIQRNRATKGEKSSLKIVIAITSLFRGRQNTLNRKKLREQFLKIATHRNLVTISFIDAQRKPVSLTGKIAGMIELDFGDFLLLQEPNATLWPIRTDDIKSLTESA